VTAAQRLAVEEAWRSGRSQRKVGLEVDLHHSTVARIWRDLEADECRPRRVTVAELRAIALDHPGDRLRVHVRITLLGRYWEPLDLVPPALSLYNPHALASGVGGGVLRDLNDEMAKG